MEILRSECVHIWMELVVLATLRFRFACRARAVAFLIDCNASITIRITNIPMPEPGLIHVLRASGQAPIAKTAINEAVVAIRVGNRGAALYRRRLPIIGIACLAFP